MDMLYQEAQGLKSDIGEVFKLFPMEEAMAADESRGRPRFEKERPEVELAADAGEASRTGKWMPPKSCRMT